MKKSHFNTRRSFLRNSLISLGVGFSGLSYGALKQVTPVPMESENAPSIESDLLLKNAKIVLEISCRAKAGETLLLLADDTLLPLAPSLLRAAKELGLIPVLLDIRDYLSCPAYQKGYVLKSLKEAVESSDIVIENLADTWVKNRPDYGRLLGNPLLQDKALTSERRWLILQPNGMEEWNISREQVTAIRKRTLWLMNLLKTAKKGRITSTKGTDFTFGLGQGSSFTPILGIIPFYGEVAVVPDLSLTSGIFVVDGPTQRDVRTRRELDKEPFRITVESGKVKKIQGGDPGQITKLKAFMASGDPRADSIDEVGLVTTSMIENDRYYWSDGTHHHDTVHIALGNNAMRNKLVHGPKHMDCEVQKPTISIDGMVIIQNGVFQDKILNT